MQMRDERPRPSPASFAHPISIEPKAHTEKKLLLSTTLWHETRPRRNIGARPGVEFHRKSHTHTMKEQKYEGSRSHALRFSLVSALTSHRIDNMRADSQPPFRKWSIHPRCGWVDCADRSDFGLTEKNLKKIIPRPWTSERRWEGILCSTRVENDSIRSSHLHFFSFNLHLHVYWAITSTRRIET